MIPVKQFLKALSLTELSPSTRTVLNIESADIARPGMQLCGHFEHFAHDRPQVLGKVEMSYVESLPPSQRAERCQQLFSYAIPCVICCRGMIPPDELLQAAKEADIPVYLSDQLTTRLCFQLVNFLNNQLAPRVTKHGVLVDVHGVGVLIIGSSGVGKSETALELVKRGHQLVADDVVEIVKVSDTRLIGECPEMVRHFMEIRGIGIIDIRAMYGIGAVARSKSIDLVIRLENWVEGKSYDRLGLVDDYVEILGVKVPQQLTPVRPGRNLAIIIEVAARNLSLKRMGYSAAHELDRRLNERIRQNSQGN